jgi:hypothetical protein
MQTRPGQHGLARAPHFKPGTGLAHRGMQLPEVRLGVATRSNPSRHTRPAAKAKQQGAEPACWSPASLRAMSAGPHAQKVWSSPQEAPQRGLTTYQRQS